MKQYQKYLALAVAAALLLSTASALAGEPCYTIGELREQTPEKWTQTYETKWRTLEVDADIVIPDVDAVPIARVMNDTRSPLASAGKSGWEEVERSLTLYNHAKAVPRSVNGRRVNQNPEAKGTWYDGFAPENTYIPLNDLTFGAFCAMINAELTRFGFDPDVFRVDQPIEVDTSHWFYYGYKEDALPGNLNLEAYARLKGIPVLSHIKEAVHDSYTMMSHDEEYWTRFNLMAGYNGYDERLKYIFVNEPQLLEILADDVPLCPFDAVRAAIEPEITAGHIRKIYEMRLGYVLYNKPGVYLKKISNTRYQAEETPEYYVKPMWQVKCLYVKSATGKLRKLPDDVYDERNTLDYYQLLVDAQTGEMVQASDAHDRCEFKGFIPWDDVR